MCLTLFYLFFFLYSFVFSLPACLFWMYALWIIMSIMLTLWNRFYAFRFHYQYTVTKNMHIKNQSIVATATSKNAVVTSNSLSKKYSKSLKMLEILNKSEMVPLKITVTLKHFFPHTNDYFLNIVFFIHVGGPYHIETSPLNRLISNW